MPHVPDLRSHATHDLELVAAHASRDLGGRDLETATALVAGCDACAELHADLRAIAAALPATPAPRRRRDFRLTPEQAASLRPAGWRRLLAPFGAPRFAFAAPLGTGLATLGLAGLLLGVVPGALPQDADFQVFGTREQAAQGETGGDKLTPASGGQPGDAGSGGAAAPEPRPTDGRSGTGNGSGVASPPVPGAEPDVAGPSDQVAGQRIRTGEELLVVLGGAGMITGLGLIGLRWSARRFI
jgi:hypothetical protein